MLAARKIFLKHGLNAPVARVAKELGVTAAALFHRMKSKEQLFLCSLWPADPPELATLEGRPGRGDVRDQLVEILFGLTSYLAHAVPAMFLLHTGGIKPGSKKVSPTMIRLHEGLANWLRYAASRRRIKLKNPAIAAEALLGALEARFLRGYLRAEKRTPESNRAFVRALVDEIIR